MYCSVHVCLISRHDRVVNVSRREALAEDSSFPSRQLAAHVASSIYFHLEAAGDALKFALESGPWLQLSDDSLYAQTILGPTYRV